ncbi:DNA mismatch repair endonuclease MutL [Paenibacillus turicensis]|uniref:DNA mismatch repair endonuclease MutL n=1 Tax=Paenibacillus turicensis TaxID=160487 RepID=UPI003D26FDB7
MAKIAVLDEHIANQIAAGEVVERPASVVKELVENAVDAGATKIEVTTEEGGLTLIRVVDNGSGIEPEDCELAFLRHATSKMAHERDLFQIRSLGFRGEALPSIASVAKVQLISSSNDTGLGHIIVVEGGNLKQNEDIAAPQGTDITVKDLFYNTPARLKYMKTIQTELGHISDVMYRQALAHPNISFNFRHNGNTLLHSPGNGDLLQVIAAIYGINASKGMLKVEAENLDYTLTGYIGRPELTRSNRSSISLIVNGRYIRNQGVHAAMLRAYHTLLPIHRYPLAVINLDMHPTLVDVNVHPAKLEVRFSKEAELNLFVEESLRAVLSKQVLIPQVVNQKIGRSTSVIQEQLHFPSANHASENTMPNVEARQGAHAPEHSAHTASSERQSPLQETSNSDRGFVQDQATSYNVNPLKPQGNTAPSAGYTSSGQSSPSSPSGQLGKSTPFTQPLAQNQEVNIDPRTSEMLYMPPDEQAQMPIFPELSLIGQHHGTYLIAQNEDGLYLIDQHAAHERVNYEYYYEKFGAPEDASQELLIPITMEFTSAETEKLKDRLAWFQKAGVILEHFGGGTFRVVSCPYWFPQGEEASIIEEMAEWVLNERAIDLAKLREKSSTLVSCKASIKANQKLTTEEATTLIQRLAACKQPYTCPHGRPIVVSFSSYDLEKLFKRVM